MNFPATQPYETGTLDVGEGHRLYWETCGNPDGKPAVVLHGGPGSGAPASWRRFFNPELYRVVLFDQRGCGRSTPHAGDDVTALDHNTTQHLIADMELLRQHLDVERWLLFGASWGSTLGLAYAVQHPKRVSELVLWAVVTTRAYEIEWLTRTMGHVHPHEHAELLAALPEQWRAGNIPAAFNALVRSPDPDVHGPAAEAWCAWEDRLDTLSGPVERAARFADPRFRLGFTRLVTHYFAHHGFLPDQGIVGRLDRIADIPVTLLRGRLDIAAPLSAAVGVANGLPRAELQIVEADAHGAGDDTVRRLVDALEAAAQRSSR